MNDKIERRIKLFNEKKTISQIVKITGDSFDSVWSVRKRYSHLIPEHIVASQRYLVNDDFFDVINSEIKAYLLGFFLADGCIDGSLGKSKQRPFSERLMVNISDCDLNVIQLFKEYVCPGADIKLRHTQLGVKFYRKPQYTVRWTSKYMTETLITKYNMFRRKAYHPEFIFPFELIPIEFQRDFIRGYFDGDGNVDFAKMLTKNGIETTRFQYGFVFNSPLFAKQVSDIICNITEGVSGSIVKSKGKTTDWWTLRFNTYRIKSVEKRYAFYEWLYKDSHFYLTRKKEKFDSFFEYRAKNGYNIPLQCNA
jgi:hypothetical protein